MPTQATEAQDTMETQENDDSIQDGVPDDVPLDRLLRSTGAPNTIDRQRNEDFNQDDVPEDVPLDRLLQASGARNTMETQDNDDSSEDDAPVLAAAKCIASPKPAVVNRNSIGLSQGKSEDDSQVSYY